MQLKVGTVKNADGRYYVYFHGIEAWDDFDMLLTLLQQENNCEILSNEEMIYIRKAELARDDTKFWLIQDDMLGNYLFSEDESTTSLLEKLARNVIDSIKQKLTAKGLL
jgi:hypothetical protein